ncbi:FAD/NAD(P)-binding domain-containing protein [Crepidotus variabilis]|uniref:Sulfide:quinone oxidoreductase, mitochondrial n=1 Tax=Crepidotus variabilis TaxID=179855 RepID=A0A9P6EPU4_9AGAR|nr:FAD/NAD(P)-binding domain-containing protein [Crepidotus variabilis]
MLYKRILKGASEVHRSSRSFATVSESKYKILVIGGGTSGLSVARQVYNRFKLAGKPLNDGDIAIVDAAKDHYYQPGWTLVGSGLRPKGDFAQPLASLVPKHIDHIPENVKIFSPDSSTVTTSSGRNISYDTLVVAAGLQINFGAIKGLSEALTDPKSGVSTIYSYDTCDKTWSDIENLKKGPAIFTQPSGIIKCAGAPQKIMWMAWDRFRRTNRQDIKLDFYTGMPTMFSVKKYSDALNTLRKERGVGGFFGYDLVSIDSASQKATFKKSSDGTTVDVDYSLLHATPPMGPLDVFKGSPIADTTGWVPVDKDTLQHTKPEYSNVFAIGDCSSLPTSKTAAAVTAQAPVLVENLFSLISTGKIAGAKYDGYTSCPLLTGYGELMLAEFKYGLEPKESFSAFFDQSKSNRFFYHLKKDLFPAAYWKYMVNGEWFGAKGLSRPKY